MTRWARSGNTQKHRKLPGDATPWEEFSRSHQTKKTFPKQSVKKGKETIKNSIPNKIDSDHNYKFAKTSSFTENPKMHFSESSCKISNENGNVSQNQEKNTEGLRKIPSLNKNLVEYPKRKKRNKSKKYPKKTKIELNEKPHDSLINVNISVINITNNSSESDPNKIKIEPNTRLCDSHINIQEDSKICSSSGSSKDTFLQNAQWESNYDKVQEDIKKGVTNDGKKLNKKQLKKIKMKAKKLFHKHMKESLLANKLKHNPISILDNSQSSKNINEPDVRTLDNQKNIDCNVSSVKNAVSDTDKKKKRKLMYLEKRRKSREEKGIILLPAKVERKLYNIRKRLKEKGISVAVLKQIMRKERRQEELKFRKTFSSKICFNCREIGHLVAECPNTSTSDRKIGTCFKCGSEDHTSFKCPNNISGFPHATCFICKQQGHISRECPQNSHGIYPKGGKCKLCGNVNHLQKDCPSLKKEKYENAMTVHIITEGKSIDDEIVNTTNTSKNNKKLQKQKVVKF